jgi:hypothetical protein
VLQVNATITDDIDTRGHESTNEVSRLQTSWRQTQDSRITHIEIDVDTESSDNGVYMWGSLLNRRGDTLPSHYRAFVAWDSLTPQVEAELFLESWT